MAKTNKYGEYMRNCFRKDVSYFFGNKVTFLSDRNSKEISYEPIIDDDTIIIRTNNLARVKDNLVLVVDHNKAVYLKIFNIMRAKDPEYGISFDLVKLNRKYFKTYTFKSDFEGFSFESETTFDDLKAIASTQSGKVMIK